MRLGIALNLSLPADDSLGFEGGVPLRIVFVHAREWFLSRLPKRGVCVVMRQPMNKGSLDEARRERLNFLIHQDLPVVKVKISNLALDGSPRVQRIDVTHVRALRETDASLPPILVHEHTMQVIDGMHRVEAAIAKGEQFIAARIFEGSAEESYVLSVQMNIEHGLPLSLAERRDAALRIVNAYPGWSDGTVAEVTGLSAKTVAKLRRSGTVIDPQLTRRVGKDGRVRPLDSSEGRVLASQVIAARPDASLREIARAAGISPNTARDVRNRLRRGEGPASVPVQGDGNPQGQPELSAEAPRAREGEAASPPSANEGNRSWEKLKRDPSLRSTEAGRLLLRSLSFQAIDSETWAKVVQAIPRHCAEGVADLAHQCAVHWEELARRLETNQL
ncbi:ParB N-terminal domain-containing protein [Streptomyces sp. NPDC050287]|uniref:ParB N-terminal domain-containing protein n=1 Tax=Streptomyces sp. NPDC050287 TaxID=3365608 RepID=UPI00379BA0DD